MENEVLDKAAKETDGFAKQQGRVMSDVTMASELMREAYPQHRYGNAKAACWHAFRSLKLSSERRARAIWNREARRIDAHEMDALRRAALEEVRRERQRALERIESPEAMVSRASDGGSLPPQAG